MKVEKDYEELLELFNKHDVRYCIIGLTEFIQSKKNADRLQDRADLEILEKVLNL